MFGRKPGTPCVIVYSGWSAQIWGNFKVQFLNSGILQCFKREQVMYEIVLHQINRVVFFLKV